MGQSPTSRHQSGHPLGDHDRGYVRIRRRGVWHHRGVNDPQAFYAVDSAGWIDHDPCRWITSAAPMKNIAGSPWYGPPTRHCRSGAPSESVPEL